MRPLKQAKNPKKIKRRWPLLAILHHSLTSEVKAGAFIFVQKKERGIK